MAERRSYNLLPGYFKNQINDKLTRIADMMYEPEKAKFLHGFVGNTSIIIDKDLAKTPIITEQKKEWQDQQIVFGSFLKDVNDPTIIRHGVLESDLRGLLQFYGGDIHRDSIDRAIESTYYSWTPPIDLDKFLNFSQYYWMGDLDKIEYIVKEPVGSKTTIHQRVGSSIVTHKVPLIKPSQPNKGDLWDDDRTIKIWDGTNWKPLVYTVTDTEPTVDTAYDGQFFYVRKHQYQRSVLWNYSENTGRWRAIIPYVGDRPKSPVTGMIWEDGSDRSLKIWNGTLFAPLIYTVGTPSGAGTHDQYILDEREPPVTGWSSVNEWRHWDDLSQGDREAMTPERRAVRPILEFWAGIEEASPKTNRNEPPVFKVYRMDESLDIVTTSDTSRIFGYADAPATYSPDPVLGFAVTHDDTGELQFEVFLETDTVSFKGHRYFKDVVTGKTHSIWAKSN
ncbi:MAG: hypothetical protein D6698_13115, partial [Gammaproteobacteria bacterium]